MRCKLNPCIVYDQCITIINNIEKTRKQLFEEEVTKLISKPKKWYRESFNREEAIVELKNWNDGSIYCRVPDWVDYGWYQHAHLTKLKNICDMLMTNNISEIELDDEDIRYLKYLK